MIFRKPVPGKDPICENFLISTKTRRNRSYFLRTVVPSNAGKRGS